MFDFNLLLVDFASATIVSIFTSLITYLIFVVFSLIAISLAAHWVWLGWRHLPAPQAASVNATRRTPRIWQAIRAPPSEASTRASLLSLITIAAFHPKFLS
jgi:hypothetical protein